MTAKRTPSESASERIARALTVGVIGDFEPEYEPHSATNDALRDAAEALALKIEIRWLNTSGLRRIESQELTEYDALLCAPGSPYKSLQGALRAIRLARELDWPLLGTCGGFQHMVIEYARNVLGVEDAQHAEYDPYSSDLFISALPCSLVNRRMSIRFESGSLAGNFYGRSEAREQYYCNFGLNPAHRGSLEAAGLKVVGTDQDGEARVIELPGLRFYLATLFVPQLRSQPDAPHPLVMALLEAAAQPTRDNLRQTA